MAETTHTAWRRERFREQQDPFFSFFFCSIRRPYITFKLPRRDKDTPLRLCNLPDLRLLGCVTSANLEWPVWSSSSGNNCHAVHRSLSSGASLWSGTFTLSYIISRAHLRDFFQLLAFGMCHIRYLRNCRCDHHRAEITIMQFIGQTLPAHHFFYGTVRMFTLSHIVSQAVFFSKAGSNYKFLYIWEGGEINSSLWLALTITCPSICGLWESRKKIGNTKLSRRWSGNLGPRSRLLSESI